MNIPHPIDTRTLSLEVPCDLIATREACRQARSFLGNMGLGAEELNAWELLLAEAANNAVQYTTEPGRKLPLRLDLFVTADYVEARLTDHTLGFDFPTEVSLPAPDSETGRGLFLIQSLSDTVRYLRSNGENCLLLNKQRIKVAGSATTARDADPVVQLVETQHTLDLMTEELSSAYESLSAIFKFSAELQGGVNAEDFARRWLDQLLAITESDWFVLRLANTGGTQLRVAATSETHCLGKMLALPPTGSGVLSLELQAVAKHSDIWFDHTNPLSPGELLAEIAGQGNGFVHPIFVNENLVGVLSIGHRHAKKTFNSGQVGIVQTFADFLGIQVRNTQFQEEVMRARLNTRDLEIAASIQHSLLPTHLPALTGCRLASHYRSARLVGGDFYDAISIGDDQVLLVVADVMGKGLPAAMFASIFRSLVRSRQDLAPQPGQFLTWLNQNLSEDLGRVDMFITAQLVFINLTQRRLRVAGAGHQPLLLAGNAGYNCGIESSGPPLGIRVDQGYTDEELAMPPGAHVLLYTDGVSEARNKQGELLGIPRLARHFSQAASARQTAEATRQSIIQLLEEFVQETPPSDDQAFILLAEGPH